MTSNHPEIIPCKNILLTGAPSIGKTTVIKKENTVIILDEIGRMECFSELFRRMALRALDSPNIVVGTVTLGGEDFIKGMKSRNDIDIIEVTVSNRNALPDVVMGKITALYGGFQP